MKVVTTVLSIQVLGTPSQVQKARDFWLFTFWVSTLPSPLAVVSKSVRSNLRTQFRRVCYTLFRMLFQVGTMQSRSVRLRADTSMEQAELETEALVAERVAALVVAVQRSR